MPPRFLTEPEPTYGQATNVGPGVRRIVAPNPSAFTYHGTNTYLIDGPDGVTVLDPGPESDAHVAAILAATGGDIARIVFTHRHPDHIGALAGLQAATGAPSAGYPGARGADYPGGPLGAVEPDIAIGDGEAIAGLTALYTPGHASDHLCFARDDGLLFSGDHVMSWSTTIVSPPDGDMAAYFVNLERLLDRNDQLFLPGHGPPLPRPQRLVGGLLKHRKAREAAIMRALADGPLTTGELVERLYPQLDPMVQRMAERTILAHLDKLNGERRALPAHEDRWRLT